MAATQAPPLTALATAGHRLFDGLSVAAATDVTAVFAAEAGITAPAGGPDVFCLERDGAAREKWTSADIPRVLADFAAELAHAADATLLPYAAVEAVPACCLAPSHALRRTLDDKRNAKRLFAALGLPRIDGFITRVDAAALTRAATQLGVPFIARAPFGSTGDGTYLVKRTDQPLPTATMPWLLETYVPGYSLNTTAVAVEDTTITLPPSVQVIGQADCQATPMGYCGSDFAALSHVPEEVVDSVLAQTHAVGDAIRALGFRGVFGVDFVVDEQRTAFPIEINPRYQNSTALLNYALAADQAPAAVHVTGDGTPCQTQLDLSQLMVYTATAVTATAVRPGIYRDSRHHSDDCDPRRMRPGEILVVGTVERDGTAVAPGAALARLVLAEPVLEADLRTLTPNAKEAVRWLRAT